MGFNICPVDVVAAPVESVWELLSDLTLYDEWWDASIERIAPEGIASPGQVIYAKTSQFGRKWDLTIKVQGVNPEKHQIQLDVALPLGTVNHATITSSVIDAVSSRLQFG
jgi:hypothetical protein